MRDTEIASIGSSAIIPQPTSQNAPKFSKWVILASIIVPDFLGVIYSAMHFSWAFFRESSA